MKLFNIVLSVTFVLMISHSVLFAQPAALTQAPVKKAPLKAEQTLGGKWSPTANQKEAFEWYYQSDLSVYTEDELRSIASPRVSVVNKFLRDEGFNIQLQDAPGTTLAVASVLKVNIAWQKPGTATKIELVSKKRVDAVKMKDSEGYKIYQGLNSLPIIEISTKRSGEFVYLIPYGSKAGMQAQVSHVRSTRRADNNRYTAIEFPMVDMDVEEDISDLIGISMKKGSRDLGTISQALQQTKFAMDEKGAKVESAAAISMSKGLALDKTLRLDNTFGVVVARDRNNGEPEFVFTGRITQEVMKRPIH